MHVEGKQCINTEWSFCSGDVVPSHLTKLADETVFTHISLLIQICTSPSHSLADFSQILLFPYILENIRFCFQLISSVFRVHSHKSSL